MKVLDDHTSASQQPCLVVQLPHKKERNEDRTYTYWGATGDFSLGTTGRDAIDIYKVTLPPPPRPADRPTEDGP